MQDRRIADLQNMLAIRDGELALTREQARTADQRAQAAEADRDRAAGQAERSIRAAKRARPRAAGAPAALVHPSAGDQHHPGAGRTGGGADGDATPDGGHPRLLVAENPPAVAGRAQQAEQAAQRIRADAERQVAALTTAYQDQISAVTTHAQEASARATRAETQAEEDRAELKTLRAELKALRAQLIDQSRLRQRQRIVRALLVLHDFESNRHTG
ncbi:hypothetical protein [Sphaerisporangium fuscum]|uniref:hypothetical protein n=1 Tax=Sphaerisporangium fuscum TaxID=2835868 RepID=UPI001BDD9C55|nr:hypothetical protein [Sphaerisporangium fuscum]